MGFHSLEFWALAPLWRSTGDGLLPFRRPTAKLAPVVRPGCRDQEQQVGVFNVINEKSCSGGRCRRCNIAGTAIVADPAGPYVGLRAGLHMPRNSDLTVGPMHAPPISTAVSWCWARLATSGRKGFVSKASSAGVKPMSTISRAPLGRAARRLGRQWPTCYTISIPSRA